MREEVSPLPKKTLRGFSFLLLPFALFSPSKNYQPFTLPVHALTMIGGVDGEDIAETDLLLLLLLVLLTRQRWERGGGAIGEANLALALLVLAVAVAGEWQQPRGRRIADA